MAIITRIRPNSTKWGYYYYWLVDKLKIKTNVRAVCPNANPTQNATITFFLNLISHAAKIKTQKLHQSCDRHVARNTVQLTLPLLPFSFSHSPSNPKPLARSKALTIHSFVRSFVCSFIFFGGGKKKKWEAAPLNLRSQTHMPHVIPKMTFLSLPLPTPPPTRTTTPLTMTSNRIPRRYLLSFPCTLQAQLIFSKSLLPGPKRAGT